MQTLKAGEWGMRGTVYAHVEKPRITAGSVLPAREEESRSHCVRQRLWGGSGGSWCSPVFSSAGSSSRVEDKVRMWFPTLWRPQKICILASCMLDLEISPGLEPEGGWRAGREGRRVGTQPRSPIPLHHPGRFPECPPCLVPLTYPNLCLLLPLVCSKAPAQWGPGGLTIQRPQAETSCSCSHHDSTGSVHRESLDWQQEPSRSTSVKVTAFALFAGTLSGLCWVWRSAWVPGLPPAGVTFELSSTNVPTQASSYGLLGPRPSTPSQAP